MPITNNNNNMKTRRLCAAFSDTPRLVRRFHEAALVCLVSVLLPTLGKGQMPASLEFELETESLPFAEEGFNPIARDWLLAFGDGGPDSQEPAEVIQVGLRVRAGNLPANRPADVSFTLSNGLRYADIRLVGFEVEEHELGMQIVTLDDFTFVAGPTTTGAAPTFLIVEGGTAGDSSVTLRISGAAPGQPAPNTLLLQEGDRITFHIRALAGVHDSGLGVDTDAADISVSVRPVNPAHTTPFQDLEGQLLHLVDRFTPFARTWDVLIDPADRSRLLTGGVTFNFAYQADGTYNGMGRGAIVGSVGYVANTPALRGRGTGDLPLRTTRTNDLPSVYVSGNFDREAVRFFLDLDGDLGNNSDEALLHCDGSNNNAEEMDDVDAAFCNGRNVYVFPKDRWARKPLNAARLQEDATTQHTVTPLENGSVNLIMYRLGADSTDWTYASFQITLEMDYGWDKSVDERATSEVGTIGLPDMRLAGAVDGVPNCTLADDLRIYVRNEVNWPLNLQMQQHDDTGSNPKLRSFDASTVRERGSGPATLNPKETLVLEASQLQARFGGEPDATPCMPAWQGRASFSFFTDGEASVLPMVMTDDFGLVPWSAPVVRGR